MYTASIELCRELEELSGWVNTGEYNYYDGELASSWEYSEVWTRSVEAVVPAYDMGYLLRKLLPGIPLKFLEQSDGRTLILYTDENDTYQEKTVYADTPEDAAAKLAIELFKQGILTREDSK